MKTFLLFLFGISAAFAQTKLISHKSHSGSSANFAKALSANLFDIADSNLGNPPDYYTEVRIDSVIYVSDKSAIVVKTSYEIPSGFNRHAKDTIKRETVRIQTSNGIFRKGVAPDFIKAEMSRPFRVKTENTVITGFDEKKPKKSMLPIFADWNFPKLTFLLAIGLLLTLLVKSVLQMRKAASKWQA